MRVRVVLLSGVMVMLVLVLVLRAGCWVLGAGAGCWVLVLGARAGCWVLAHGELGRRYAGSQNSIGAGRRNMSGSSRAARQWNA